MSKFVFSDMANSVEAGVFAMLNEKKQELLDQGRKVFNLSIGTPDFVTQPHIMEAMKAACDEELNYRYSIIDIPELIEAVQYRYRHRFGVELAADEIMSVYGSQEGMSHIGMCLCNPGDVMLIPNPGYPLFETCGWMAHADIQYYTIREENGYLPDFSEIPQDVLDRCKFMIVSYPLNPVCKCATDEFYVELIEFAKKNNIIIIHDNAYSDIIYTCKQGKSFLEFPGAKDVGVELYSLSKTYNLTGARVSFVVGNREIVQKFKNLRSQFDYGMFLPIQKAAIAALTGPDDFVEEQRQAYERRNKALCGGLRRIGWDVPDSQGTMFCWGRIPEGYNSSFEFCMDLMEKTGLIVTPGSAFGSEGEGYVRFALVINEEKIAELIEVLDASGIFKK